MRYATFGMLGMSKRDIKKLNLGESLSFVKKTGTFSTYQTDSESQLRICSGWLRGDFFQGKDSTTTGVVRMKEDVLLALSRRSGIHMIITSRVKLVRGALKLPLCLCRFLRSSRNLSRIRHYLPYLNCSSAF